MQAAAATYSPRSPLTQTSLLLAQRTLGNRSVQRNGLASLRTIRRDSPDPQPGKPGPAPPLTTRQVNVPALKGVGPAAVALVTPAAQSALAAKDPEVHVLIHYHGHTGGYGDAGGVGKQRAAWDQIGPQIEAGGRPVVAILPQAGIRADKNWGFGKAASKPTDYITAVMAQLASQEKWSATPKYAIGVSGHSGGGFQAANALAHGLKAEEVILLDGINGWIELGSMITWVEAQLNDAFARLQAAGADATKQEEALASTVRFRAYHHGPALDPVKDKVDLSEPSTKNLDAVGNRGYAGRYAILKDRVDKWFTKQGAQLSEMLRERLRKHFEIGGTPGSGHEDVVGKSLGVEKGLKRMMLQRQPDVTAPAADPDKVQWEKDWIDPAFAGARAYFNEKGRPAGTPKERYDILCPMYKKHATILRPLQYITDNIKPITFFQFSTSGHSDLKTKLAAAEKALKADKKWTSAPLVKAWSLTVRTTSKGGWSNHATGKAIDFDEDTNPHLSNPAERKVTTALTGIDIAAANPGQAQGLDSYDASLAASTAFKSSYNQAGMQARIAILATKEAALTKERDDIQKELTAVPKGAKATPADAKLAKEINVRLKAKNAELAGPKTQKALLEKHLKSYEAVDTAITAQTEVVTAKGLQIDALTAASTGADPKTAADAHAKIATLKKALTKAEARLKVMETNRDQQRLRKFASGGFLDLNKDLVTALKTAGLEWGGDWRPSKDFMHFQT